MMKYGHVVFAILALGCCAYGIWFGVMSRSCEMAGGAPLVDPFTNTCDSKEK